MTAFLQKRVKAENQRFYVTTQTAYWAGLLTHSLGFVSFLVLGITQMALFNGFISVPFFLLALLFNANGKHSLAFFLAIFELYTHQVHAIYYLGWTSGWQYWFLVLAALIFFNAKWSKWARIAFLAGIAATLSVLYLFFSEGRFQMEERTVQVAFLVNSLSSLVLVALLIRYYTVATARAEKKLHAANQQLVAKNAEVQQQNNQIVKSIAYAERIQQAVIPGAAVLKQYFPDHFIIFRPKDIVSGDFYWFSEIDDKLVVVCADCTGHGVPGGFMSMLGITQLNEIVNHRRVLQPAQILEQLRQKVKETLGDSRQKDGIDMSVCLIDKAQRELHFAGAFSDMFRVRQGELSEFKATRNPIGKYVREIPFTEQRLAVQPGDRFYLYTDGFLDQFGGPYQNKYMRKRLKSKILQFANLPFTEQGAALAADFEQWQGQQEQTDDTTLMGFCVY